MEEKFVSAVRGVTNELSASSEVTGIVWFGSVQRGEGTPASDLDFYVVTEGPEYWRVARRYQDVPVELFFNPPPQLRLRFANADVVALRAFATGTVLWDKDDTTAALAAEAKRLYDAGPQLSDSSVALWRWRLTSAAHDLEVMSPGTPEATLSTALLITQALEGYCIFNRMWTEKPSKMLAYVATHEQRVADIINTLGVTRLAASSLVDMVLAQVGGRLEEYRSPSAV